MTTSTPRHLEIARRTGYAGIEARAERLLIDPDEVRAAAAVVRAGEVWSLNGVRIGLLPDGRLDRAVLEADLPPRLDTCRALGAPYLLAVPPRQAGLTVDAAMPGLGEGLQLARDRAAAQGIRIAFEFLGFWDCPVRTPAAAGWLIAEVEGVDLVLDSCHWHASQAGSLDGFPVERLAMVHLNDAPAMDPPRIEDADRLLPGEGVIALPELLSALTAAGYTGPWSLETFNPSHWSDDPAAVARRGRAGIERLLGPVADGPEG